MKNNNPKVSVIVPVYNVEAYIDRCLKSLVNQTLKDIEIIVVNDGSPDNSQSIIDNYSRKYKNIKCYIKPNGGLSDARNFGLKYATGNYIAFVDSDDYVSLNMYELLYNKAILNDYDLVVCDLFYDYSAKLVKASSNVKEDSKDIKKIMNNIYPSAWNKLYKKELFDHGIEFKKGVWYEDVEFLYRLLPYIKSVGVVKENLYYYVQRDGAITKTFDDRLFNYIDNWNGIIDFYKKKNLYEEYKKELEYSYVRYLYATFIKQASNYKDENKFKDAVKSAIKNVKKQFPNYKKNSYFYKSIKGIYLILFNKNIANLIRRFK